MSYMNRVEVISPLNKSESAKRIRDALLEYEHNKPYLNKSERINHIDNIMKITMDEPEILAQHPSFRESFIEKYLMYKDIIDTKVYNDIPIYLNKLITRSDYINYHRSRYNLRKRLRVDYNESNNKRQHI